MLSKMPTAAMLVTSELPPKLTKGSVTPVGGAIATTTAQWIIACSVISDVSPTASNELNISGA
jgi:hypothetical protein